MIDHTHDGAAVSWVAGAQGHSDFPVQNLPFGIFSVAGSGRRVGVAIGDRILDLTSASDDLEPAWRELLRGDDLNALFAAPSTLRRDLRQWLFARLTDPRSSSAIQPFLVDVAECALHLPARIGDYTDFYTGIHHAQNATHIFDPAASLNPNYRWVPIAYHGRASSIRPSGTDVVRPWCQQPSNGVPDFAPSRRLDYELEMGVWIGEGNHLGEPIPIASASDHLVGLCLLNDWSARDTQFWEMQPLGPFLSKNLQTNISPWVVTREALAPFRIAQPTRPRGDPAPLPYLLDDADQRQGAFAIDLDVHLSTERMRQANEAPHRLSRAALGTMYWTAAQMIAHHSSNGCDLRPGDLLGTGTISGPDQDGCGSMLELARGGRKPVVLPNGETRSMLEDGDEVVFTAHARAGGFVSIGFGECRGKVLPARG